MIDSMFSWKSVREKQCRAPLLRERESYLGHLRNGGVSLPRLRVIANYLLHVVRLLEMDTSRSITLEEIAEAGALWAQDQHFHISRKPGKSTARQFRHIATNWLNFQGLLIRPSEPSNAFQPLQRRFLIAMEVERGLSAHTLRGYGSRAGYFLRWF